MMVVKMIFGSHLYGTNTPSSDTDFKGVGLPTWNQIALGQVPKHIEHSSTGSAHNKNTSDDVDVEIFSLHNFIKLACEGETCAVDMLHAPGKALLETSEIWKSIVRNRNRFYSKNIHAFVGYAIKQAAKYGIKGSRLNNIEAVLIWIDDQNNPTARLSDCDLSTFPSGDQIQEITNYGYDICSKKFQNTCKLGYIKDSLSKFYDNYGERARQAADNKGIDWKAISHAFRAAYQMRQLFTEGIITFPLSEANFLRQIKQGELLYNDIAPQLEELIDEIKQLRDTSSFPEKVNFKFWHNFLIDVVENYIMPSKDKGYR